MSSQGQTREIKPGTLVIYMGESGTFEYGGPSDDIRVTTFDFSVFRGGKPTLITCHPRLVAPADTPIPATSDRVGVDRMARGAHPPRTPWRVMVDRKPVDYCKTKKEAVENGLRAVAVLEWHAATPEPEPSGEAPSNNQHDVPGEEDVAADVARLEAALTDLFA